MPGSVRRYDGIRFFTAGNNQGEVGNHREDKEQAIKAIEYSAVAGSIDCYPWPVPFA